MSNFYYPSQQQQHHSSHSNLHNSHSHHAGRSRRATRASTAHHHQHHQKQMRALRIQQKEAEEERVLHFRREFDAARSFDFEDDDLFCPFNLMTDDDLQSMSSGSDRSSMSSGSPDHSPITTQVQPAPSFLLPPPNFQSSFQMSLPQTKIHQPMAQRSMGAKAIPIVDPSTRSVASPPPSVSPGRQMLQAQQFIPRRVW